MPRMSQYLESIVATLDERAAFPVGTTRTWKRGEYTKTADGWRRVGGGTRAARMSGGEAASPEKHAASYFDSKMRSLSKGGSGWTTADYFRGEDGKGNWRLDKDADWLNKDVETGLLNDYMDTNEKYLDKKSKEVAKELNGIVGDNPKVAGLIKNLEFYFSSGGAGSFPKQTKEQMQSLLKSADSLASTEPAKLQKVGITKEQAKAVGEIVRKNAAEIESRMDAVISGAKKSAPAFVQKMRELA